MMNKVNRMVEKYCHYRSEQTHKDYRRGGSGDFEQAHAY